MAKIQVKINKLVSPSSIDIGGYTYSIEAGDDVIKELRASDSWSDVNHDLRRLRFDNTAPQQQLDNNVWHETMHAINNVYLRNYLEEGQVTLLANGLHQVMKQLGISVAIKVEPVTGNSEGT